MIKNKNNPILQYWQEIKNKNVVVPKKIYRTYKEIIDNIINNPQSEYEYSSDKAEHAIEFIERYCKHSKGSMGGKPFIMELWQKALVASMFGIVDKVDGLRKYQEVVLVVGRKNGRDLPPNTVMC